MHYNGKLALAHFIIASNLHLFTCNSIQIFTGPLPNLIFSAIFLFLLGYFSTKRLCDADSHEVAWRAHFLGLVFSSGTFIVFGNNGGNPFVSFGWYMIIMSVFHFSEYLVTSVIRPQSLNSDSFLLNHSKAYGIAALTSWLEFFLELWLIPGLKQLTWLSYTGLVICITGEFLRKLAMLTAGSNFDHLVRVTREANHQLVTSGIYKFFRHPSYVGWFYWSVGTQLVLCNPLCFFAYFYASWKFFAERIFQEEITLIHFFGKDYVKYQKKVPTGLPFIKGYEH